MAIKSHICIEKEKTYTSGIVTWYASLDNVMHWVEVKRENYFSTSKEFLDVTGLWLRVRVKGAHANFPLKSDVNILTNQQDYSRLMITDLILQNL